MTQSAQESARVALMLIWAPDQHVKQFVKLSEIYLERGNIFSQSALAIRDVNTKECKHIIKENSGVFLQRGSYLCSSGLLFLFHMLF